MQTIFGRAKVRITRKGDNFRRALWRMAVVALAAIAFIVWQGWYANRQTETTQSAVSVPAVNATSQQRAPVPQTENIVAPVTPAALVEPRKPEPAVISKPAISQNSSAQTQTSMKAVEKEAAKPVITQPKPAVMPRKPVAIPPNPTAELPKPVLAQPKVVAVPEQPVVLQAPAVGASNSTMKPQTIVSPAAKPLLPKQPGVPAAVAPPAVKVVAPASSPVAVPALVAPLVKEDAPTQPPVTDKSPAAPINGAGK